MAAYEVLLLNTAIPQIQAAQSGDTYVVPRDIAINATAIISANSATDALRITQTGTGNALLVEDSANPDSSPFVVTATGNVGIGTSSPGAKLDIVTSSTIAGVRVNNATAGKSAMVIQNNGSTVGVIGLTGYWNGNSDTNFGLYAETGSDIRFSTNGVAAPKAIIDTFGNLGLGVTPSAKLEIYSTNNAFNALQVRYNGSNDAMGFGIGNSNGFPYLGYNTKSQASVDAPVYERSNPAAQLRMDNGSFKFNIAPSGTANTTTITNLVSYTIITSGNQTDFGAANNNVGTVFTANASGTLSSGTVSQNISFTQAMTLDASGKLLVGTTTSPNQQTVIYRTSATTSNGALLLDGNGNYAGIQFAESGNLRASLAVDNSALYLTHESVLTFRTGSTANVGGTERARITSGGYFKASDTGTYNNATGSFHELYQNSTSEPSVVITTPNASYTGNSVFIEAARNTTNNTFYALSYYNSGAAAYKFRVADSGDVTNTNGTYGTISDAKMKTDIVDAGSQWADIKALRFRKFKMKNDPSGLVQLGVVAQEVELTSPGLVDEHADRDAEGNDLGTTTKSVKTSVLLMKAAVALQEAMARIEQLEAEVAALKGA